MSDVVFYFVNGRFEVGNTGIKGEVVGVVQWVSGLCVERGSGRAVDLGWAMEEGREEVDVGGR